MVLMNPAFTDCGFLRAPSKQRFTPDLVFVEPLKLVLQHTRYTAYIYHRRRIKRSYCFLTILVGVEKLKRLMRRSSEAIGDTTKFRDTRCAHGIVLL